MRVCASTLTTVRLSVADEPEYWLLGPIQTVVPAETTCHANGNGPAVASAPVGRAMRASRVAVEVGELVLGCVRKSAFAGRGRVQRVNPVRAHGEIRNGAELPEPRHGEQRARGPSRRRAGAGGRHAVAAGGARRQHQQGQQRRDPGAHGNVNVGRSGAVTEDQQAGVILALMPLVRKISQLTRMSAAALVATTLAGCAQIAPAGGASPTPLAPPSPSPTASPVAAMPCRLPANLRVDQGGNREVLGYLALPSGTTTDDPTDAIVKVADFPVGGTGTVPVWGTVTSPQLFGESIGTFSPAAQRWLPAAPELVSPDGLHYAYLHANGTIRLAAPDGSEIPVANPNNLVPLAYTSSGVVLVESGPAANGLWLLDPATQSVSVITPAAGTDDWLEVSGTIAFGLDSPGTLGAPLATAVLVANLVAGTTPKTVYTAAAGDSIAAIAADRQGGVLVVLTGASPGLVYVDSNAGPKPVAVLAGVAPATIGPRHHADAHGIWFIGGDGIFLFNPAAGLQKIAAAVTADIVPGGDCV